MTDAERVSPSTRRGQRLTEDRKSKGDMRLNDWINAECAEKLNYLVQRYRTLVDAKASRGKVLEVLIKGGTIPEQ